MERMHVSDVLLNLLMKVSSHFNACGVWTEQQSKLLTFIIYHLFGFLSSNSHLMFIFVFSVLISGLRVLFDHRNKTSVWKYTRIRRLKVMICYTGIEHLGMN